MLLSLAVDLFLGEYIPSTRRSYEYNLREMCAYVGAGRPLAEVTSEDLIRFGQFYRAKPTVTSPATFNKLVKTLRTFFNWCIKTDLLAAKSPAAALRRQKQTQSVPREKAMPDAAYNQLLDFAKWDVRGYALVLFLGDTGCRIGGAAGLRWSDINFVADQPTAQVTEKGTPARPVFFGKLCENALLRLQAARPGTDSVFGGNSDCLKQFFRRLCVRAGVGSWGPHSLRHRKGHQFGDNRVNPVAGAMVLGNSVEIMLAYYYPQDWDRAAALALEFTTNKVEDPLVQPRVAKREKRSG